MTHGPLVVCSCVFFVFASWTHCGRCLFGPKNSVGLDWMSAWRVGRRAYAEGNHKKQIGRLCVLVSSPSSMAPCSPACLDPVFLKKRDIYFGEGAREAVRRRSMPR
jgi:hypothetical protein